MKVNTRGLLGENGSKEVVCSDGIGSKPGLLLIRGHGNPVRKVLCRKEEEEEEEEKENTNRRNRRRKMRKKSDRGDG
ncbi:hypothetical protein M0804_006745 [Polistes exclamans]|nr:hypothetical protein M0804_006745 [Polistes exclamans]